MSDIFACRECRAVYTITRLPEPPTAPPHCEVCGSKFPPRELGEWLAYQHAEPEWNVKAWLTDIQHIESDVNPDDQPENSSLLTTAGQSAVVRAKAFTTLTGGVRKIAALITRD
jgi:hypothetical protein